MNVGISGPVVVPNSYVYSSIVPSFWTTTLSSTELISSVHTTNQMASTYYAQLLVFISPLTPALKLFAICSMVVGGAVPFVPQYLLIRRTSSAEGFSLYVCLTLLAANILRIFFWFGKRFETPLLLQSGIMIAMMFALIKLCVDVRTRSNGSLPTAEPTISYRRRFRDMNFDHFWHWHDFSSYIECALCYAIFCAIITFLFGYAKILINKIRGLLTLY
jgi:hypothetical protein